MLVRLGHALPSDLSADTELRNLLLDLPTGARLGAHYLRCLNNRGCLIAPTVTQRHP
jgi:hypothetical protein